MAKLAMKVMDAQPPDGPVSIRLLGGFRLLAGGAPPTAVVPPRLQSFIALLVLRVGTPLTREQIMDLLWPEIDEHAARGNLRTLLYDLRRSVPEVALSVHTDHHSIAWTEEAGSEIDVRRFEVAVRTGAVEEALDLYLGDLLPGCYDDWIVPERERLRSLFLDLLQRGALRAEKEGDALRALELWSRLAREEPLQEESYRAMMRLQAAAGNEAAALRTYHLCARTLEIELGIPPGPATQDLYRRLVEREEEPGPPAGQRSQLTAREREWALLQRAWQAAAREGARGVLLVGEPGIGKTRLLEEMAAWTERQGIAIYAGRCYAGEAELGLAPITAMLRSRPLPPLEPVWLAELVRILPELALAHPDLPSPGPLTESWQRARLFEALARTLLAREPVLLAIDDLQWVDAVTHDFLHYLLTRRRAARLLILATARPEGPTADGERDRLWADVRLAGALEEINLLPLDREAAVALAADLQPDATPDRLHSIWRESEGNPLFIVELARSSAPDTIPRSMRAVLDLRLAGLTPAARRAAEAAAVSGRAFRLPVLQTALHWSQDTLLTAIDELWRCRIIRASGEGYDFSHDKLRQAAYTAIPLPKRRALHRAVADALPEVEAGALDAVSAEIAAHLEAAGQTERAASFHYRAGDAARTVFANAAAIRHYRRAADLSPPSGRLEALLALSDVLQIDGNIAEAAGLLHEALILAESLGREREVGLAHFSIAMALNFLGDPDQALWHLRTAQPILVRLRETVALVRVFAGMSNVHAFRGEYQPARANAEEALRMAETSGDRRAILTALQGLGVLTAYHQFGWEQGRTYALREIDLAAAIGDPRARGVALLNLGLLEIEHGSYFDALAHLREAYDVLTACGEEVRAAVALVDLGLVYRKLGVLDTARRCYAAAARRLASAQYWHGAHVALAQLGHMAAVEGDIDIGLRLLRLAVAPMETAHLAYQLCETLFFLADALERAGDLLAALDVGLRALVLGQEIDRRDYMLAAQTLVIRVEHALGRRSLHASCRELADLLPAYFEPHRQAAIHHAIWHLDPEREDDRARATELYAQIYPARPNDLYRRRFRELTGTDLTSPPVPSFRPAETMPVNDMIAAAENAVRLHQAPTESTAPT